jgi:membrane-bound metal-dependent hydrolase YbcI (DUF457 family)
MSSLLGHVIGAQAALGLAARIDPDAARSRRAVVIVGILAVLPDLDLGLYFLLGRPGWLRPHAGPSHSLIFAALLGFIGALFLLKTRQQADWQLHLRAFGCLAAVAAAHLGLDSLSQSTAVRGVPLLWPWGRLMYSPVRLLPDAYWSADSLGGLFRVMFLSWRAWVAMLMELLILVPLVVLAWRRGLHRAVSWTLAGLSTAGVLLSYILYQMTGAL